MPTRSSARVAAKLYLALLLAGCGPSDEAERAKVGPIEGPFVVSQFFTPSGLMGDGAVPGRLTVDINERCKVPRPPGAQGDCYRFVYQPGAVKWSGVYWVAPANNWGTSPGRDVKGPVEMGVADPTKPGSPPLRGYNRLRFSMASEPLEAQTTIQFWGGRLDGRKSTPPQPFYDRGCSVFPGFPPTCTDDTVSPPAPYAFSPAEESGQPTPDWQTFTVDLSRWSVESVIGAFGFSTNDNANPGRTQVIYFDDIVWE
jgi:hypothetical protein